MTNNTELMMFMLLMLVFALRREPYVVRSHFHRRPLLCCFNMLLTLHPSLPQIHPSEENNNEVAITISCYSFHGRCL